MPPCLPFGFGTNGVKSNCVLSVSPTCSRLLVRTDDYRSIGGLLPFHASVNEFPRHHPAPLPDAALQCAQLALWESARVRLVQPLEQRLGGRVGILLKPQQNLGPHPSKGSCRVRHVRASRFLGSMRWRELPLHATTRGVLRETAPDSPALDRRPRSLNPARLTPLASPGSAATIPAGPVGPRSVRSLSLTASVTDVRAQEHARRAWPVCGRTSSPWPPRTLATAA